MDNNWIMLVNNYSLDQKDFPSSHAQFVIHQTQIHVTCITML